MALTKWTPTTDLMTLRRAGKFVEEGGEALAVVARLIIQGIDELDPGSGRVNRHRLMDELADLRAQIECSALAFGLDQEYMARRTAEKMRLMAEWEAMFPPAGSTETGPAAMAKAATTPPSSWATAQSCEHWRRVRSCTSRPNVIYGAKRCAYLDTPASCARNRRDERQG